MQKGELIYGIKGIVPYFPKAEKKGVAQISHIEFDQSKDMMFNLRAVRDGGAMFRMYDGKYVRLHINGQLMMSDTGMERISNKEFIEKAQGRVLIAGLGLGLIISNIIDNPYVQEVVVIEKYQDVIDLVSPKFTHPKLKVICADIDEWRPEKGEKFDTIYFDIWADISTENLDHIKKLHNRFKSFKQKDGWMNSWMKEYLQKRKREENKYNYY
jgi:spermidine synthase